MHIWFDLYCIFGLIFIAYLVWSLLHIWFDLYWIFGSIFIAYLVWSSLHIWFDLYCIFGSIFIGYLVRSLLHIWFDLYWIFGLIFIGYLVWSLLDIWFDLYWIFGLIFIAYLVWSLLHIWFDLYWIFGLIFFGYLVWSLLEIFEIGKGWIFPEYSTCVWLRSLNQYLCQDIQTKLIKSELIHWTFLYIRWSSAHQVGHVGFLQVLWMPPTRSQTQSSVATCMFNISCLYLFLHHCKIYEVWIWNICPLVLKGKVPKSGKDKGGELSVYRDRFIRFLKTSKYFHPDDVLPKLPLDCMYHSYFVYI